MRVDVSIRQYFLRHRSTLVISWLGRKGNLLWRMVGVGVVSWEWMNS